MANVIEKSRQDISARMKTLEPVVQEFQQLEQASTALSALVPEGTGSRPAGGKRKPPKTGRTGATRGRPRGSGQRGKQALRLIEGRPGVTIPELAKAMRIKPNYLYRVLPALEREGKVKKQDKGWAATA
jgi:hypothetical protein